MFTKLSSNSFFPGKDGLQIMNVSQNVLIIGGCGFLGKNLARRFLTAGDKVYIIDFNDANCKDYRRKNSGPNRP